MTVATQCDLCKKFETGTAWTITVSSKKYDVCSDCLDKFDKLADQIKNAQKTQSKK